MGRCMLCDIAWAACMCAGSDAVIVASRVASLSLWISCPALRGREAARGIGREEGREGTRDAVGKRRARWLVERVGR
eukprot:3825254-Rhodomonas_salina.1